MPGDTPFDAALAALDVEPTHHTDRMVTTYDILGLDAVRAAHRAEVERAVAEEREACATVCFAAAAKATEIARRARGTDAFDAVDAERIAALSLYDEIRARGAKS